MVQINLSLLFVAAIVAIAPTLALPLSSREDTNTVGSAFSRRFYGGNSVLFGRDTDFDLERRLWFTALHGNAANTAHWKAVQAAATSRLSGGGTTGDTGGPDVNARFFDDFDLEARDVDFEN